MPPHDGNSDVFLVLGQSNMLTNNFTPPLSGLAPTFPNKQAMTWTGSGLTTLSGQDGPMAAFGSTWFQATGRSVVIINASVGGSSLLAVADQGFGNWSPTGTLLSAALAQIQPALNFVSSQGGTPFKNAAGNAAVTGTLYALGERDANAFNEDIGGIDQAAEIAALQTLIATVRATPHVSAGFYISRLGYDPNVSDEGFAMVRGAQEAVANPNDPNTMIMFWDAVNFANYNMLHPNSTVHYNQQGYNLMGASLARNIHTFFASIGL